MIIDTSLLMCYLRKQESLANSLLRLKDNNCHVEETEIALKERKRYASLIIFYNSKALHRQALELLRSLLKEEEECNGEDKKPPISSEDIIQYLQGLGASWLELIFEFAEEVIREDPSEGIRIFIEEMGEVESLPRQEVYEYLAKIDPVVGVRYLEHVIGVWGDTVPGFHNQLVLDYTDLILNTIYENQHDE
ncbi:Uncharacterized protein FKW44_004749, partial [Caligus rogercresseyi]